jgi:hypothetical protein
VIAGSTPCLTNIPVTRSVRHAIPACCYPHPDRCGPGPRSDTLLIGTFARTRQAHRGAVSESRSPGNPVHQ